MKSRGKKKYYKNEALMQHVGHRIAHLRLSRNLTQLDLAILCKEIDVSQIGRMERGEVNFSISYLFLVARALEVRPGELFRNYYE